MSAELVLSIAAHEEVGSRYLFSQLSSVEYSHITPPADSRIG